MSSGFGMKKEKFSRISKVRKERSEEAERGNVRVW